MKIDIILVDDHDLFLEGLAGTLSKHDHIQVSALYNTAEAALQGLKSHTPDLVITDVSMPKINGLEFVKLLNETYPDLKILVISMFRQIQSFKGIKGYLLKETKSDELLTAIDKIVVQNETYFYKAYAQDAKELEFNTAILTPREKTIVDLIAKEHTTDDIAKALFLSRYTIETHKKNIYLKLQVNNAAGLIKKAVYLGYIH
jgi:DNA-binding NarL/FixJ family response regulator